MPKVFKLLCKFVNTSFSAKIHHHHRIIEDTNAEQIAEAESVL